MKLARTCLSFEGRRIWLEGPTERDLVHFEYRHGELGLPAQLKKESPDGERQTIERDV